MVLPTIMDAEKACVGLGTMLLKESCEDAVSDALSLGVKIVDTGEHYENLELVGKGLAKAGVPDAFVVTKLSGLPSGDYATVKGRMQGMLQKLGIARASVCLMHWPGLCSWDVTDPSPLESPESFADKQTSWDEFKQHIAPAWANMKRLKEEGLVAEIGCSNFYAHHLEELAVQCNGENPFANEIFIDATNQEISFVNDMHAKGIKVLAYRPVRYPFPEAVEKVAERHGVSKQIVVLAWLIGRGIFPLVKCRGGHIKDNAESSQALQSKLTPEDLEQIAGAEVGIRMGSEWFAKIWASHNATGPSEEDVAQLVMLGIDEEKARDVLSKCNGNMELAMDMAFE